MRQLLKKCIAAIHFGRCAKVVITLLILGLVSATVLAANGFEVPFHVIGGGGGRVAMDSYVLDSTIGQPVAGLVVQNSYELCAGFWCGAPLYKIYLPLIIRNV